MAVNLRAAGLSRSGIVETLSAWPRRPRGYGWAERIASRAERTIRQGDDGGDEMGLLWGSERQRIDQVPA